MPFDSSSATRTNLVLATLVVSIPASMLIVAPESQLIRLGVGIALVGLLFAFLANVWLQPSPVWLRFVSAAVYTSLVSLAALTLTLLGSVDEISFMPITISLYLLVIGACSLRNDPRLPVATGVIAGAQYLAIDLVAAAQASPTPEIAEALAREFSTVRCLSNLALIACCSTLAMVIARRGRQLEERSIRDDLTGLLNRAIFDRVLEVTHERASRDRFPISIAMFDLDHFKALNDEHGHAMGDRVLEAVGESLRRCFPAGQAVARYGGEEFVAMVPDVEEQELTARLELLREEIEAIEVVAEKAVTVTISGGVACWPDDGLDPIDVIHAADRRLYEAKRRGRNRIVGSRGGPPEV